MAATRARNQQVSAWSGLKRDGNYDFTYDEDGGREIADHAAKMNNKWW